MWCCLTQVRSKVIIDGKLNANIVGQSVQKLAALFGITVPASARMLVAEVDTIGKSEPLSEVGGW
jgi:acetaldehyde dehydrogenase/alcohol dehydrogenase